jgi:hypothetical protein
MQQAALVAVTPAASVRRSLVVSKVMISTTTGITSPEGRRVSIAQPGLGFKEPLGL